jgi:hypothetical protein
VRDEILLAGAKKVTGVAQFMELFSAAVYDQTKITLLRSAVRDAKHIEEFVQIAMASSNYAVRDEILLKAIPCCKNLTDVQALTSRAVYDTTKAEIVRQYNQMHNFATLYQQ